MKVIEGDVEYLEKLPEIHNDLLFCLKKWKLKKLNNL